MKPLVYYCRWQQASLRLRGRDETAVWGHLVYKTAGDQEQLRAFRFDLKSRRLFLETQAGEEIIHLDEMGTVRDDASS